LKARAVLLALGISAAAGAQSVDPPIAVLDGAHVRGSVVISNPTIFPFSWVLEPKQFTVACGGDVAFAEIDTSRIHLRLSSMSGRLAAKQRATIFYEVTVDSIPSWFAIVVGFYANKPEKGLNVKMEIPHIVYLMQREKVRAADVAITSAQFDSTDKRLRIRLENHSGKLTRVTELLGVTASGKEYSIDACPLFPNAAREFTFTWPDASPPVKVIARFAGFSIDLRVTSSPPDGSSAGGSGRR
jgi:hypothetical protein